MANYSINITDNGDGSWTLTAVKRAPTFATGGTDLVPVRTSGDAVGTTTGWKYTGFLGTVVNDAAAIVLADLTKNGN